MTLLDQLQGSVIKPAEYQIPTKPQKSPIIKLTIGHWILAFVALLCLLFIAFITLARSVQVITYTVDVERPDERLIQQSNIQIDSLLQLPIGNRVMVLPGDYDVVISAEGHQTYSDTLAVLDERYQQFDINLVPLPGQLDIDLQPEISATVSIEDELLGQLPGLIENVPVGIQQLSIDSPLYRKSTQTIVVQGKGQTQSLAVELDPAWAELSLDSEPSGANLLVDGEVVGLTPMSVRLEEGSREIEIQAQGFKPYKTELVVVAQQPPVQSYRV
ncbi:MAG: PEGA domain-containing protein [Acidiferrobacterales bacterium]|nr:PEGA domain-containing protein [Acidiferrobacterales bacterium]